MRLLLLRAGGATLSHYNITYPMGLLYLGAAARQIGAEVRVIDCRFPWNGTQRVLHELAEFRPQVVGLSALTQDAPALHRLAELVRRSLPGAYLAAGGAHPTIFPRQTMLDRNLDAVVVGEGERSLVAILEQLGAGQRPRGIPGVLTRESSEPGGFSQSEGELDDLPTPAWDLVDERPYAVWPTMAPVGIRRYRSLVTSRGCPYRCIYCHRNHGKRFRPHSAERVIEEIADGVRQGVTDFEIIDDVFNLDRRRVLAIMEGVLRRGLRVHFQFPNGLRSDLLDEELIGLMRRAGTNWMSFAIETANERLQELLGKRLQLDRAREAICAAERAGVFCDGFFMLGLPTETEEEAQRTLDFACDSPLHTAKLFRAVAFPGTDMFERFGRDTESGFGGYDYFYTRHNLSQIPEERLAAMLRQGGRRFYGSARRLGRVWRAHPGKWSLPFFGAVVGWRSLLASYRMLRAPSRTSLPLLPPARQG